MSNEFLIACALKGTFVLILAVLLSVALRRAAAATRHLVWTAVFTALLLLPVLSLAVPRWTVTVPQSQARPAARLRIGGVAATVNKPVGAELDWVFLVWLAGATLVLGRFGVGTARIWLIARRARPMAVSGVSSGIRVLDAGVGAMPLAWRVLRPVILLPSEAAAWPPERLRAVLLHELAHIARHDCWTLAMAELGVALYWFHPLAWWAASRMRRERERACDDRVLAAGIAASGYATDLLEVARGRLDAALPAPAMARASNLEARLRAILDPTVPRRDVRARAVGAAAAGAFLILAPLAALRLHGQGAGILAGTIYDASGARVPGATVSIVDADSGQAQTMTSNAAGNFSFANLTAGRYQVMVSSPGFAVYARKAIEVPATLDVFLSLGQVAESVTVSGKGPQSAPRSAPQRLRVGGNVQAARLLQQVKPIYPASAEAAGISGTVLLRAIIGNDGTIMGLTVSSSPDPALSDAAVESVRQWRYQPTLLNGQPVEVLTTISVNFRLDQ
jgi:TonB family protein